MVDCPHCGSQTPEGGYCIHCGAQLPQEGNRERRRRQHAYASYPREHVLHLSVITTLFPHLTPQQTQRARWLLLGGAVVVFFVALGRLVPLAIVLAVLLMPLFYLAYFYFAKIFGDEPLPVLLATFACGAVLGAVMSAVVYPIISGSAPACLRSLGWLYPADRCGAAAFGSGAHAGGTTRALFLCGRALTICSMDWFLGQPRGSALQRHRASSIPGYSCRGHSCKMG